jgi:hypothetical protein
MTTAKIPGHHSVASVWCKAYVNTHMHVCAHASPSTHHALDIPPHTATMATNTYTYSHSRTLFHAHRSKFTLSHTFVPHSLFHTHSFHIHFITHTRSTCTPIHTLPHSLIPHSLIPHSLILHSFIPNSLPHTLFHIHASHSHSYHIHSHTHSSTLNLPRHSVPP